MDQVTSGRLKSPAIILDVGRREVRWSDASASMGSPISVQDGVINTDHMYSEPYRFLDKFKCGML